MSKKNKWTLVPFILFAALILTVLYFLTFHRPPAPAELINAVPLNASLVVRINDITTLFEKTAVNNAIWNELQGIPGFRRTGRQMRFLDSLFRHAPDVEEILQNPPSFISAHYTGKDRISLMHVFQLPPRYHEKKIVELISGLVVNAGTIKTRKYDGVDIHEVTLLRETAVGSFSFAVSNDILMISFSAILLEDAIRQLAAGESLAMVKGFNEIYATAGKNVDANVFINFQHFPKALSTLVKPDYKAEVRTFRNFAGWAEMDVNQLPDMLLMNGFVAPPDSLTSFAGTFLNQSPQRLAADQILPGSVASFFSVCMSDPGLYFSDFKAFLQDQGKLAGYLNTLASLNNTYGTNLPDDIVEIIDNEYGLAFDPGNQESIAGSVYFFMRIKSNTQAEEKLAAMIEKIAAVEARPVNSYTTLYKLDNELSYKIHHLAVRKFTAKLFGNLFSALDEHYFAIIENYLVFSSSVESIKSLIHNVVLNKTLQNNPAFQSFKNSLSPRSNLYFYCDLSKGQTVFQPYLTDPVSRAWAASQPVFQKVRVMGFQLYTDNKMLHANLLLKYLSDYDDETQTVWESKLDTLADFKPVFVLNHQTGQNEVFVQDLRNNIYLINQVGRILWKVQLPEPINSEVFQIDYFRNGKLQLLFSTKSALYLIDRNGNFVEKYPVRLRSPATSGVSVFDYENSRDYRLFIACEDRHVYAYTKEGSLIPGWGFERSEREVTQPVEHFRIGDKDFIVFGDGFKTYILDRKGNTRVEVEAFFPKSARNGYLIDIPRDGSGPGVVTTDTVGKIYFIGFNGKLRTLEPSENYTGEHFFDYKDLTGDGKPEFIYLEGKSLTVYSNNLSKLFTHDFDSPVLSRPLFYQFSATDRKLGIVSRADNHIYLINNNGEVYAGFPLQGNTPFSIGNFGDSLSKFNLVVGSRDNFLYNYRVK